VLHADIVHTLQCRRQEELQVAQRTLVYGTSPEQIIEVREGIDGAVRPLVIIIHGGFWRPDIDRTHARPMADSIAAAGFTVLLPEYSRVPGSPQATLADIARILSQAPGQIAPHNGRVILIGHSAGGQLALWAAASPLCPALIGTLALAPVADLMLAHRLGLGNGAVSRFLGGDPALRADLDPRRMPAPQAAITLLHGVDDDTVPLSVSESYVSAHPGAKLIAVDACGHYEPIDPRSSAWPIVMAQLELWVDRR
jgi:acetyl esterase/lipase